MGKNIRRYQGNNYPFKATISKSGDFSLVGMTVEMVFKIGNNVTHTLAGTVVDAAAGKVEFIPTPESVAEAGVGFYDINVDDGTYSITYQHDDIELLKRVAP